MKQSKKILKIENKGIPDHEETPHNIIKKIEWLEKAIQEYRLEINHLLCQLDNLKRNSL